MSLRETENWNQLLLLEQNATSRAQGQGWVTQRGTESKEATSAHPGKEPFLSFSCFEGSHGDPILQRPSRKSLSKAETRSVRPQLHKAQGKRTGLQLGGDGSLAGTEVSPAPNAFLAEIPVSSLLL